MDLSVYDPLDPLAEPSERRQLRETVRALIQDVSPHGRTQTLDNAEQFDDELYDRLAVMGVLAIDAPDDVGGAGDLRDQLVVIEELAAGPTSMAAFLIVQYMIIQVLRGYASTPLQRTVLGHRERSATYYLSDRRFVGSDAGEVGETREKIFAFLHRNSQTPAVYFSLPSDRLISMGTSIDL